MGSPFSLSEKFRWQGVHALQGLQLWQSYVNARGGIATRIGDQRSAELICYDDQSAVKSTRSNVVRLLKNDSVDILLGPYSSGLTMGAAEMAEQHKKLLWNHGGSSDEIYSRGFEYLVGVASPASYYLRGLPRWLAQAHPDLTRNCVLYSGRGHSDGRWPAGS